jgi:hypothetical protein
MDMENNQEWKQFSSYWLTCNKHATLEYCKNAVYIKSWVGLGISEICF